MKYILTYFLLSLYIIASLSCKKKTTINVSLFNPALNQFVPGATIALVERTDKISGVECREIATAVTDAEGRALFDGAKLRSEQKYQYFCAVTESWGISQGYPCAGLSGKLLSKGKDQEWKLIDEQSGTLQIQYENLLSPGQIGDSLSVIITFDEYFDPVFNVKKGGGYLYSSAPSYGDKQYPYPPFIEIPPRSGKGGIYTVRIHKIKLGHKTTTTEKLKLIPGKNSKFKLVW